MTSDIEIYLNDIMLNLPDGEDVAINKQSLSVGELTIPKSDFSREFKVKRTREMNALFENSGIVSSETDVPYIENDVHVYFDGLEVIKNAKLKLARTDDYFYYINIYSGLKDIFNDLNNLTLNDLDLSDLEHTWNIATEKSSIINNEDYQYLLFEPSDDGGLIPDSGNFNINGEILRPFIRVSRLFEQVFTDYGVAMTNDIATDGIFQKMFIPITTLAITSGKTQNLLSLYGSPDAGYSGRQKINFSIMLFDPLGTGMYTAKYTGKHYFKLSLGTFFGTFTIDVDINGVQTAVTIEDWDLYGATFGIDLVSNDVVDFYLTHISGFASAAPYCMCIKIDATGIGYGSLVNPEKNLPAIKQGDFIKCIMNYFGLTVKYDNLTGSIAFKKFNNVLDNKYRAKDWTSYLSVDSIELTYSIEGYAQRNNLKWKEDDDVEDGMNNSYFTVDDRNLEKEQDLFKFPFASTNEVVHQGEAMSIISWYKSIEGSASYNQESKITERIVSRESFDSSVDIELTSGGATETIGYADAKKARSFPLHLSNTSEYYKTITQINKKAKVLTAQFNLPSKEVEQFDQEIPIFLEQFGEYFYVNRIINYRNGYLCECELMRIY